MKALVLRLALGLALGVSATGTLAAAHNLPNAEARGAATTTLTGFFSDKTHPYGGGYIPTSSIKLATRTTGMDWDRTARHIGRRREGF